MPRPGPHVDGVGAENPVTSCDLDVLVEEAAKPISSEYADGRSGTWWGVACGRALIAVIGEVGGC